jgi:hypothetical protein
MPELFCQGASAVPGGERESFVTPVNADTGGAPPAALVSPPVAVPPPTVTALPVPAKPARLPRSWLLMLLAGAAILLAIVVPLSPVWTTDPVVSWPAVGQPVRSTVLPLSPYRPLRLDAVIPCATAAELGNRPGDASVLRTVPAGAPRAEDGMAVTVGGGRLRVVASRHPVFDVALPSPGCSYGITADASGLRVSRDGAVVATVPGLPVPEVSELATDADGLPAAAGLAVHLHTDDRYASHPGAVKTILLVAELLALGGTVIVACRRWPGSGARLGRPRWGAVDAAFGVIGSAWVLLGPLQYDDAWYELMARNSAAAGYVGNYIYMFNVTESPFVASQYLAQLWGDVGGWSLWWMRVLPLLYAVGTWVLLRMFMATVLGRAARRRWVGWALLGAFLAWWLPYGMVLRPEPLIMLLSAAVLLLAELARRRLSVGILVCATACAALALTVSPSGLVAWAPLPLALPWLRQWWQGHDRRARIGAALALVASTTVVVPIVFTVSSLADALEAVHVHKWYYVAYPWYEEWLHYETLLGNPGTGSWGRRGPVLLTLGVLLVTAIASGRALTRGGPLRQLLLGSAVTTAIALVLLGFSPTKAILHFGAVVAPATVLLTVGLLRTPLPRKPGWVIVATSVFVAITMSVLTFAGPNLWHPYSDRGMPFGDHIDPASTHVQLAALAPHFGRVYLRNAVLWLAVAVAVGGYAAWRRRRRRHSALTPDRGVLVASCTTLVLGMIAVFVYAPVHQYPGWTIGSGGAEALGGNGCGLAADVTVLMDATTRLGPSSGPEQLTGDFALAAALPSPVPAPSAGSVWHDDADGGSGVGSLVTPWYRLPARGDATNVTVPVIGNNLAQQQLAVEFDDGGGALVRKPLRPDPSLDAHTWQELAVPLTGSVAVRVVAADVIPGSESWLAVGQPRLTRPHPVTDLTAGQPVFADQLTAPMWPCVNQVTVADGITQAPTVRLLAADGVSKGVLNNESYRPEGGVWAHVDDNVTYVRMASSLRGGGPPTLPWGQVERVLYDHPVGRVDIATTSMRRQGWSALPTLAAESYAGFGFEDRPD